MIIADTHGLCFFGIDHFVIEGKIGNRNKKYAVCLHIFSEFFQDRIVIVIGLACVGEVKADKTSLFHDLAVREVVCAVRTSQVANVDFAVFPPHHFKFEYILVFLGINLFIRFI